MVRRFACQHQLHAGVPWAAELRVESAGKAALYLCRQSLRVQQEQST
jgi:hypothetical protein